jgi:hypothetical protein
MTNNKTKDNEHIWGAVELVAAKARNRLALLQQRVGATPALAPEIEELERIERQTAQAWLELNADAREGDGLATA